MSSELVKLLHVRNNNKIFSIGFIVNVGSRDEKKNQYGLSHFLEHMLCKTTSNRTTSKLLNDMDSLGISYNASTSHEYTFYELHGDIKNWKKIVDILVELFLCSKCYKKDIDMEKGVILEEYNMVTNSIDDFLSNILFYQIYGSSSLGRPIIGTINNIKKFNRNVITKFRNKFYSLKNINFVSIGNVTQKIINKYLVNKINKYIKTSSHYKSNFVNVRDNYLPLR